MRPIRLELEGFTSFRKRVEVDFSNLDIFAITGPTGAGKTSLIDALIYALYGRTPRIGERGVADLMTQGAKRLSVLLEFQSAGRNYRIARTMRRSGHNVVSKPQLEILQEDEKWEALAGSVSTIRAQVGRIIGLDFDAFTRSVVLPQGEFDRFLKGSSAERRKILTELLQLEIYLRMGRLARDKAEKARSESTFKKELLGSTYAEASQKNLKALQREINQLKRRSSKLEKRLQLVRQLQPAAQDLRLARQEVEKARQEIHFLKRLIRQARKRRDDSQKALDRSGQQVEKLENQIEEAGYDEKLHFDLNRLTPHAQQLSEVRQHLRHGRERLKEKTRQQKESEPHLKTALLGKKEADAKAAQANQHYEQQIADLEKARRRHGSSDAIRQTARRLGDREQLKQQFDGLARDIQAFTEQQKTIGRELKEAAIKAEKTEKTWQDARQETAHLRHLHAADDLRRLLEKGQPCPVCEQLVRQPPKPGRHAAIELAEKRQEEARLAREESAGRQRDLQRDLQALPAQLERRRSDLQGVERSLSQIEQQIEQALACKPGPDPGRQLEELAEQILEMEKRTAQAAQQRDQALQAAQQADRQATQSTHRNDLLKREIESLEKQIADFDQRCKQLEKELKEWPQLDEIERQLAVQEKARQLRDSLADKLARQQQASRKAGQEQALAIEQLQRLDKQSADASKRSQKLGKKSAGLEKRLSRRLEKLFEAMPLFEEGADAGGDESERLEEERDRLEGELKGLQSDKARRQEQHKQLEQQIEEARRLREEIVALEKRRSVAYELGRSLQANRFISFIQEEAVRRLAADGTGHLNTLSAGRYSFSVEQDSFEVLDHWNADEARPVATLSGGESFLASLSLALALADSLSEFCTDREKLSLDSLFLDEGFSTLDPETLDTVVQSVETLAQDERLIGVISHIPELAERLPSRIQVRKSISGSTLAVE